MKAQILVALMLLAVFPPTVVAQDVDPGDPTENLPGDDELPGQDDLPGEDDVPGQDDLPSEDDVPDPDDLDEGAAFDEAFVPVERFPCPPSAWANDQLDGRTAWRQASHDQASDACVAQWGEGTYRVGSQAALTSPGLPTDHLAASSQPGTTVNDVFRALLDSGVDPRIGTQLVAQMSAACSNSFGFFGGTAPVVRDSCKQLLESGPMLVRVPDANQGTGNLFLDLRHAFEFSDADDNDLSLDGGWVEIKQPGGTWTRLDPIALYSFDRENRRVLCSVTGPAAVATLAQYRSADDAVEGTFNIGINFGEDAATSQSAWEEACQGLLRTMYRASDQGVQIGGGDIFGQQVQGVDASMSNRLSPYPGVIRGEGPGFVGTTRDASSGQLQFVEHWFDLTPYAGEMVQVRFHATGGPGSGVRQGGWWVDDVDIRYAGPPHDLALRLEHPSQDDSFPKADVPVQVELTNLGRAPSEPVRIQASLAGANVTFDAPALQPLQSHRASATLPNPGEGQHEVTARILDQAAGQGERAPYGDTFPMNDESVRSIVVENRTEVSIEVQGVELEEDVARFTVSVRNDGNAPATVPLVGRLMPVDQVTRLPRPLDAQPLGVVEQLIVPHGKEANSLGVEDPTTTTLINVTLPHTGVWRLALESPLDEDARDAGFVAYGEAAPPAMEEPFAGVSPGGLGDVPRGAFELRGQDDTSVPQVARVDPRHPLSGPQTRYVPFGEYALASSGAELQEDYTPVSWENVPFQSVPPGQVSCPVAACDDAGVDLPGHIRSPASAQAWNVREHHVAVYGVGTTSEGDAEHHGSISQNALKNLDPKKGERVLVELDHAAKVHWTGNYGSQARLLLIPKSTIDVPQEIDRAENLTRNLTANLPPEVRPVVEQTLMGVFFDGLAETASDLLEGQQLDRIPEGPCEGLITLPIPGQGGQEQGVPICGDPRTVSELNGDCSGGLGIECDLTEEDLAYYIQYSEEGAQGVRSLTWDRPTGWENITLDVTELAERQQAFYVVFDLVTTSDFETVLASAEAGADEEGSDYTVRTGVTRDNSIQSDDEVRAGWSKGEQPLWTVDRAKVTRYLDQEAKYTLEFCDLPQDECPEEDNDERGVVPLVTNRGWRHLPSEFSADLHWSHEPLGGDPTSLDPGALVWRGGTGRLLSDQQTGELIRDADGNAPIQISGENPGGYGILRLPTVDLSGFEQPTVNMHVKFGRVEVDGYTDEIPITDLCEQKSDEVNGTVWTQTGWNVRARPVQPDGSLGEATTVVPVTGYDDCNPDPQDEVPIQFDANAVIQTPNVVAVNDGGQVAGFSTPSTHAECFQEGSKLDPLELCSRGKVQFGHGQPVFGLPMDWQDVQFDLSAFKGQRVALEIHAYGVEGRSGFSRGELRVDTFDVAEGAPPVDLAVSHEKRPAVAPDTEERFALNITNQGRDVVEQVSIRRTILDADGCQYDDAPPVVISTGLSDPDGKASGLPPGTSTTVLDTRLGWEAPNRERQLFERLITVDPRSDMPLSERPTYLVEHKAGSREVTVTLTDTDDCADDLDFPTPETLHGDPVVTSLDGNRYKITGDARSVTKLQGTDKSGVQSLPLYITPPAGTALNGTARAQVLQSHPGSLVNIVVEPATDEVDRWTLYLPTPDGLERVRDQNRTTFQDLPPGQYVGYVSFPDGFYDLVRFTIEPLPAPGSDATPGNNVVNLRGQTRALPRVAIADLDLDETVRLNDEITLPITVRNTGNVPLHNLTTSVHVEPADVGATDRILLLEPGDERVSKVTLRITDPGAQRITIDVVSDEEASTTTGALLRVMSAQNLVPETGDHAGWNGTQFGNGVRVPAAMDAPLPLDGVMDLSQAPLSTLYLNHSGKLESSYDGVAIEWRKDGKLLEQQLDPDVPTVNTLTSSHAGAKLGDEVQAISGDIDRPLTADSTEIQGATPRAVDEITAQEWSGFGSFQLDVDRSALDGGKAFWVPTATVLEEASGATVRHTFEVVLSEEDWCEIANEVVPRGQPLRIETTERRLFSEPTTGTRGWEASVQLVTGEFSSQGGLARQDPKIAHAEPVVPLPDEEVTGWESVSYDVQMGNLLSVFERGLVPFVGSGNCDGNQASSEDPSRASIVFLLETSGRGASSAQEGLDLGWFLGTIEIPALGISVGPSDYKTLRCAGAASGMTPAPVRGCTRIETGKEPTLLDMNATPLPGWVHQDDGRIQVVALSQSDATYVAERDPCDDDPQTSLPDCPPHGADILDDLLEPRAMELERRSDKHGGDVVQSPGDRNRFTYVDATTLLDLRAGTEGVLFLNVTPTMTVDGLIQVSATPVLPGEVDGEEVGHRVPWQPLELLDNRQAQEILLDQPLAREVSEHKLDDLGLPLTDCRPETVRVPVPHSPLGATPDQIVGAPPAAAMEPGAEEKAFHHRLTTAGPSGTNQLCANLTSVAGHMALVTVRAWMPGAGDNLTLDGGQAWLRVAEPQQLRPQLRAVTDDTVHEGTYTLHDAAILSLAPRFSHAVRANLTDTVTVGDERVLIRNGLPDLEIQVDEPGIPARWDLAVNITVSYTPEGETSERTLWGDVDLDEDTFEGAQTLTVPWETLREGLTHEKRSKGKDQTQTDWIQTAPALPANVTSMDIRVVTVPDRLTTTVAGCDTDIEDLQTSQEIFCRRLADLVSSDDRARIQVSGPGGARAGVTDLRIEPDRAPAGTPRTAILTLENPKSQPVGLDGNITLEDTGGQELGRMKFPTEVLRPGETTTVTLPLEIPKDEPAADTDFFGTFGPPSRVQVTAEIGETKAVDDYRTLTEHPSDHLDESLFTLSEDSRVEHTAAWAKPALPGEPSDGFGFHVRSPGGGTVTTVSTNFISVDRIREILHDGGGAPLFSFYHQRQISVGDNPRNGEFSFMAIDMAQGEAFAGQGGGQIALLDAWGPGPAQPRPNATGTDGTNYCAGGGPSGGGGGSTAEAVASEDDPVFMGTVGGIQPAVTTAWVPVVAEIPVDELPAGGSVQFRIHLAECNNPPGPSELLLDQFSLGSSRPLVTLGEDRVPIQPGTTKRYRFELENAGLGSETVHVVPGGPLPEGWQSRVLLDGGRVVYDSQTGALEPVELHEDEHLTGTWQLSVPSGITSSARVLPLTAYAAEGPALASSGSMNKYAHRGQDAPGVDFTEHPGEVRFEPTGDPLPDLRVQPDSVTIEEAEVGRQPILRFQVRNTGEIDAENVAIRAAVDGPSGFQELKGADGEPVVESFSAVSGKWLTFTWTDPAPSQPGIHTLRVVADPGPAGQGLLLSDTPVAFTGLTQESGECDPDGTCENMVVHRFEVKPLQQPDLSLRVQQLPDRIATGQETQLRVVVENKGGVTATGATLTLSENGLLPILDALTVELPDIQAGDEVVLTPTWAPVTPGDILVMASVSAPDEFSGRRADGSLAGEDNDLALAVQVDKAGLEVELSEPLRTRPGTAKIVNASLENTGTATLQVLPEVTRRRGVLLSPLLDAPLTIEPGTKANVTVMAFATLDTTPRTLQLGLPLGNAQHALPVHVLAAPAMGVVLEEIPLKPGSSSLQVRVVNQGNVPLNGTLHLEGEGILGTTGIDVDAGSSTNATLDVEVAPGTAPGLRTVSLRLQTDEGKLQTGKRVTVAKAPAAAITMATPERTLGGSNKAVVTVTNVGNQPLTGRLLLNGGAQLVDAASIVLPPGESTERTISWVNPTARNATATVVSIEGDLLGEALLETHPETEDLRLVSVSTRPSVNLREGMDIQVLAVAENVGETNLTNVTLGVTVDGELHQTFELPHLAPGETTVVSTPLELPRDGRLSLGVVDLAAFQEQESAGPVTTVDVEGSTLSLNQVAEVPTIPWPLLLLMLAGFAAGVRRE